MHILDILSSFGTLMKFVRMWPLRLLLPREGDQIGFGVIMGYVLSLDLRYTIHLGSCQSRSEI